jgi:hypothetical protein
MLMFNILSARLGPDCRERPPIETGMVTGIAPNPVRLKYTFLIRGYAKENS